MTDAINPRGLFDRSALGRSVGPVTVPVERGQVRFFARAVGETGRVHTDLAAARAAGHPDLVAPPSFIMAVEAAANEQLQERGERSIHALVGCDFRYLLHGDERYAYHGLIHAGETVTFTSRVTDFYDKKGGAMEFVVIESVVAHAERGDLVRATRSLLHRLPAAGR